MDPAVQGRYIICRAWFIVISSLPADTVWRKIHLTKRHKYKGIYDSFKSSAATSSRGSGFLALFINLFFFAKKCCWIITNQSNFCQETALFFSNNITLSLKHKTGTMGLVMQRQNF